MGRYDFSLDNLDSRMIEPFDYIYYDTLLSEDSAHLRMIGKTAQDYLKQEANSWSETNPTQMQELAKTLLSLADVEYQKEVKVLSEFYGLPSDTISSELYQNNETSAKTIYSNIMQTLQQALNAQSTAQNVLNVLRQDESTGKNESRGYKTSAAHLIRQNFINEFQKYIQSPGFKAEQVAALQQKDAEKKIQSVIRICLERAVTKVAEYTGNDLGYGGSLPVFEELYRMTRDKSTKNMVINHLLQTLNVGTMTASLIKDIKEGKQKKSKRQKTDYIGENLIFGGRGQVGSIEEAIVMATSQFYNSLSNTKGDTFKFTASVGKGKLANTDFTHVIVKSEFDTDKIARAMSKLETTYAVGDSKMKPLKTMEEFTAKINKITSGQFAIIQETTKAYVLGTKFDNGGSGFHGTTYGYESFKPILKRLNGINPQAVLSTLLNLREGTVLGNSTKYRSRAEAMFTQLFADMMFERPRIEIPGGNNVIYVFRLTGTVLPLSYVLRCAGLAAQQAYHNMRNVISFKIRTPKLPLKYKGKDPSDPDVESSIYLRWRNQRAESRSEFEVSINFMQNFVALLNGDIKAMIGK